jgi:hypothetical protein
MPKDEDRDAERRRRLAAALRDNLKRRKAQDRARRGAAEPVQAGPSPAGADDAGKG